MACVPNSVTNLSIIFFPFCKCFKCSFRHLVRRPPTSPKNLFKCQWRSGIHGPPHIPGAGTPKPTVQGGPSAAPPPPTPHRPTTVCMRTRPRCAGGPQSGMRQLRRPGGPSASAGTGGSPHMPRSRGHGRPQRCPSRHEHSRRGPGRQAH